MKKVLLSEKVAVGLIVSLAAFFYAVFSLLRHIRFSSSGYDLGIFDQLLWQYQRFAVPVNTIRDVPNLLGDHFHPILLLLTPFYKLFPGPETLLILQALIVASSGIPVYLFARKLIKNQWIGYALLLSYLCFWGILRGVGYDFHEVALAVPLIAWAIYFLQQDSQRNLLWMLGLLLLVKEDQALVVAMFGVLLLLKNKKVLGMGVIAASILWFIITTKLIIPYLGGGAYAHWSYSQLGPDALSAAVWALTHPVQTVTIFLTPSVKIATLTSIFSRFLFLPFGSSLIILSLPILASRFLSTNSNYWVTDFHYTLAVSPILMMATIEVMAKIKNSRSAKLLPLIAVIILAFNVFTIRSTPFMALTDPNFYQLPRDLQIGYQALDRIPPDASVLAQDALVPHLSSREKIYTISPWRDFPEVAYIIVSDKVSAWPLQNFDEITQYLEVQMSTSFEKVFSENGWVVYKRK